MVEHANTHLGEMLVEESERMPPPSVVRELHLTAVLGFNTSLTQPGTAMTSLSTKRGLRCRLDPDLTRMILRRALLLLATLISQIHLIRASALTVAISANQRLCFFADVDKEGEKIGVSIAANLPPQVLISSSQNSSTLL